MAKTRPKTAGASSANSPTRARRPPPPPARPATSRAPLWIALVVVVLAAAAAIGIASTRGGDDDPPVTPGLVQTAPVVVEGASLAPLPDDPPDPALGATAPTVTGQSFDGAPVALTPGDGTPTLALFVAHWCPHCQREVPLLAEWINAGENPEGVDIMAVSTAVESSADNYPPSSWLAGENWPTPVLVDDAEGTAAQAYGLTAFPYYVLLDGTGAVIDRWTGEIDPTDLGDRITTALA